mmetsp:Transcript_15711/g.24392  ORF Transcript_15711/g.24392 Transcript_15711/m.24392 type:complete len:225 (-) Transcript_15711:227-901(-)
MLVQALVVRAPKAERRVRIVPGVAAVAEGVGGAGVGGAGVPGIRGVGGARQRAAPLGVPLLVPVLVHQYAAVPAVAPRWVSHGARWPAQRREDRGGGPRLGGQRAVGLVGGALRREGLRRGLRLAAVGRGRLLLRLPVQALRRRRHPLGPPRRRLAAAAGPRGGPRLVAVVVLLGRRGPVRRARQQQRGCLGRGRVCETILLCPLFLKKFDFLFFGFSGYISLS